MGARVAPIRNGHSFGEVRWVKCGVFKGHAAQSPHVRVQDAQKINCVNIYCGTLPARQRSRNINFFYMKMRTSVNKQALKSLEGNILTHYRRHECEMFIMMAIHGIIYIKSLETKS